MKVLAKILKLVRGRLTASRFVWIFLAAGAAAFGQTIDIMDLSLEELKHVQAYSGRALSVGFRPRKQNVRQITDRAAFQQ